MRGTKLSDSLPTGSSRPGGGLSASAKLAVGGLLWLLFSLAVSCWVQWRLPETPPTNIAAPEAVAPLSGPGFDAVLALNTVDTLFARVLPLTLPAARWQRVSPVEARPAKISSKSARGATTSPAIPAGSIVLAAPYMAAEEASPAAFATAPEARLFRVTDSCAPLRLGLALIEGLRNQAAVLSRAGARAEVRWSPQGTLEVLLNDLVYYVVSFPGHEGQLADLAQPLPQTALAIVIDDMGQRLADAEELAALPFAVTMAIWPRSRHARETAEIAASRRLDCLLHQPMEALPRPRHGRPDPGPGALFTGMSEQEIQTVFENNLRTLPTVIGFNNHMGSAFTGDFSLCAMLCGMLGGRGLAVLDSVTRSDPQLAVAARDAGLVNLARDVFLDTRRDTAAIATALDAAAARARAHGMAVAIGHPYPETLRALRDWQDREGVAVVPLRRMIWKLAQDKAADAARPHTLNTNMEKE